VIWDSIIPFAQDPANVSEQQQIEKVRMKIGDAEFEAEGTSESIEARLAKFAELVGLIGKQLTAVMPANFSNWSPIKDATPTALQAGASTIEGGDQVQGQGQTQAAQPPVTDDLLTRVFRRDGDTVSLLALPRTEQPDADALVALLYAFQRLLNKPNVTGVTLMQAARQSGVLMNRVDVPLKSKSDLVMAAGARRGRRYSLNNRGNVYAEALIRRLVE
jgi:hypothetical protein